MILLASGVGGRIETKKVIGFAHNSNWCESGSNDTLHEVSEGIEGIHPTLLSKALQKCYQRRGKHTLQKSGKLEGGLSTPANKKRTVIRMGRMIIATAMWGEAALKRKKVNIQNQCAGEEGENRTQ